MILQFQRDSQVKNQNSFSVKERWFQYIYKKKAQSIKIDCSRIYFIVYIIFLKKIKNINIKL
jgi:hypothetical protein